MGEGKDAVSKYDIIRGFTTQNNKKTKKKKEKEEGKGEGKG